MPKIKTRRAAAKRFKKTGTGKFKFKHNFTSHILETKSPGRKRKLRKAAVVSPADQKRVERMLPHA
ncbi:MAG: 50S ribosomal protein L35 [Bacillota bacterium]|nr:50S ribosomal protein L35 [Bacillota bacterium]